MATVHPSSQIGAEVSLGKDVSIGPHCTLSGPISIGAGTVIQGHCYLTGPLVIGERNRIYPFGCLGFEPQDYKYDPSTPGAGLTIGDDNILREYVSIHRATSATVPTRIGHRNMFMAGSHAGHDAQVGNACIFANAALIAGHAHIADRVNIGGGGAVAQHIRIGRLAFLSGTIGANRHIPPFMVVRNSTSRIGGVNLVGMRRAGMTRPEIDAVKWAFRVMFLQGNSRPTTIEALAQRAPESPAVAEIMDFLQSIRGPVCEIEADKRSRALDEILNETD